MLPSGSTFVHQPCLGLWLLGCVCMTASVSAEFNRGSCETPAKSCKTTFYSDDQCVTKSSSQPDRHTELQHVDVGLEWVRNYFPCTLQHSTLAVGAIVDVTPFGSAPTACADASQFNAGIVGLYSKTEIVAGVKFARVNVYTDATCDTRAQIGAAKVGSMGDKDGDCTVYDSNGNENSQSMKFTCADGNSQSMNFTTPGTAQVKIAKYPGSKTCSGRACASGAWGSQCGATQEISTGATTCATQTLVIDTCTDTCTSGQPRTCAEYNVLVAGCARSCSAAKKLKVATEVDPTNKCGESRTTLTHQPPELNTPTWCCRAKPACTL